MAPSSARPSILFVHPPSLPYVHVCHALENTEIRLSGGDTFPMGLLYLAAQVEKDLPGVDARILDYALVLNERMETEGMAPCTIDEFMLSVLDEQIPADFVPDVVGITILFSTAHKTSLHIAEVMKRRWPGTTVVVGGMHASNAVKSLLACPSVDYVCRGEGETAIAAIVDHARRGENLEAIRGVFGRDKLAASGDAKCMESAVPVEDLDQIPFPAWHLLPMEKYIVPRKTEKFRRANIVTTRGCPFSCTFCSSWTVHGRAMRFRSTANVLAELDILIEKYGVNAVLPWDDLFTVKKSRIIELCRAIAERFRGRLHFDFPNGLSVATLDEEVIDVMVEMGLRTAEVAIESGSDYVQRHIIKKNCNLDRARKVVAYLRQKNTISRALFIVGFPYETREQIMETIDYSASLGADWNVYGIAAPLIGTEMYEIMLKRGDIDESFNWDNAFYKERTFDTPEIAAADLKKIVYDANIKINFFGNTNLKCGNFDRAIELFQGILDVYHGHLVARYCIGLAERGRGNEAAFRQAVEDCRRMLTVSDMARDHYQNFPELMPELAEA